MGALGAFICIPQSDGKDWKYQTHSLQITSQKERKKKRCFTDLINEAQVEEAKPRTQRTHQQEAVFDQPGVALSLGLPTPRVWAACVGERCPGSRGNPSLDVGVREGGSTFFEKIQKIDIHTLYTHNCREHCLLSLPSPSAPEPRAMLSLFSFAI